MALHEIKDPKVFNPDIRKFETTDKAHANLFNAVAEVLINNDAFLYSLVDALTIRMTQELAGKVPVTRKVNNKALSSDITLSASDVAAIPADTKGAAGGVAELDSTGKVLAAQLPSFVDDVVEGYLSSGKMYEEATHITVITGEAGKIYIDLHTSKTYRWSGTAYVVISDTIALGETASTAYRGDRGKIAYDHSQAVHAPSNAEQNVQADWNVTSTSSDAYIKNKPTSLPANGGNASTVNNKTVESNVPANAKFTDTTYSAATQSAAGLLSAADKKKLDGAFSASNLIDTLANIIANTTSGKAAGALAVKTLNTNMQAIGTIDLIREVDSTSYQSGTIANFSSYKGFILSTTRNNPQKAPLASSYIPASIVSLIKDNATSASACFAKEPSNYEAKCYFSGSTLYLKSASSYDTARFYGVR